MTETKTPESQTEGGTANAPTSEHSHHPSVGEYVEIGAILGILTAIEVVLYYAPIARNITVPSLIVLTIAKFSLVVMWFMHLRFDSKVFRRFLVGGMLLAAVIYAIAIILVL